MGAARGGAPGAATVPGAFRRQSAYGTRDRWGLSALGAHTLAVWSAWGAHPCREVLTFARWGGGLENVINTHLWCSWRKNNPELGSSGLRPDPLTVTRRGTCPGRLVTAMSSTEGQQ